MPTRRTVTGSVADIFTDAGAPVSVTLACLPHRWTDETGGRLLVGPEHVVAVTAGAWSASLIPTDEPGIEPATGRYYRLTESLAGIPVRTRTFEVPRGDGSPIDILDLVVADPALPGYVRGATGATGATGPPGPQPPLGAAGAGPTIALRSDDPSTTNARTPVGQYGRLPSDQNLIAWTGDPNDAGHVTAQSSAGVAGRITLVQIPIREQITWSNIWLGLSGIDAAAVLSTCYLGVYNSSGTLMGATADISASLMTNAIAKPLALASPFTAAPGMYYIAMLLGGTWTTNSLTFKATGAGISVNAGLSAGALRYSNMLTGQTSLPGSLTLSSQSTSIINTGWGSQWYGVS